MDLLRNRIVLGIGALVILLAAAWAYFAYFGPQPPTRPLIIFEDTIPENSAIAGQPVVIFASVSDPEGIAEVELWINGEQVATQTNDASTGNSFDASLAFIPSGAGNYLAMLRALDGDGYSGDSDPLAIVVSERNFDETAEPGEYFAQEGDTTESLAALFGVSPLDITALNPSMEEISAGTPILIPASPEGEAAGDPADGVPDELDDIPVVDPPLPPSEPREAFDGEPPEPASEPWWYVLPLPDGFICFINPASCGRAIDIEPAPFPAPSEVDASPAGGIYECGYQVHWKDESENELGFRIYRFTSRPRFRMDLILTQPAVSGSGTDVTVVDESPPLGTFFYAVVAYNAGGDTWSAPSNTIVSEGCPPAGPVAVEPLVVEILELETEESFDKLYCYASLAGSPFERVPYGASNFITLEAGEWNIAEHFSGVNRREVYAPSAGPLIISGECLGWQGEELIRIGLFNDSSMPEEWDGRLLNAGMLGGTGFNFTYRVNHSFHAAEESGRAAWPVVNPDIPAPFDLRTSSEWVECPEDVRLCARREEPALLWRWEYPGGVIPDEFAPRYYKVYRRLAGQPDPVLHFTTDSYFIGAPLLTGHCSEAVFYSVSAVVRPDPVTGGEIQSPLSEEFEVPPTCASLEITLDFLWVYGVHDGDPCTVFDDCRNDYEAYGWMSFNGQRVIWNDHCDPGFLEGCLTSGPSYSRVLEASEHSWSSLSLNTGDGFRRNNNVITIPIRDGESLDFRLTFRDHDSGSADDLWCGGTRRNVISEGPHSAAEWLAFNQSLEYDGNCIVHFTVRGIPAE